MSNFPRLLFFLTLVFIQHSSFLHPSAEDSNNPEYSTAVLNGYGYSSDLQQVTRQACFNAKKPKISGRITDLQLQETVSHSDLQKTFNVDLSASGSYGLFAANGKAEYLKFLQEDEYSVSLNYYVAHKEKVTVNINGIRDHALTDFGREVYNDQKLYNEFGSICGDHYIVSYQQGAALIVGLKIELENKEHKDKLDSSFGANYGLFADVAGKIESVSNSNKISGKIQVHAHQLGGDSTELAEILSDNIASCDIKDTSQCLDVIKALVSYAKDFGKQIKNSKELEALGSFEYFPISRLGLVAPNSLVTPKVLQFRNDLAFKLKENQYYKRKLSPFVSNKYPVKLQDKLIKHLNTLLNKAEHNLRLILDPNQGAVRCFNTSEHCEEIKNQIYDNLKNIATEDLKFVKGMKYVSPVLTDLFYNIGEDLKIWKAVRNQLNEENTLEMVKLLVSHDSLEYQFNVGGYSFYFNGTWDLSQQAYVGKLYSYLENSFTEINPEHTQKLKLSPFFFEEYNSSMDPA